MRWCCRSFESAYQHAGRRGFALLIGKDPVIGQYFIWQHRVVDKGREAELPGPYETNVITDTGLLFCPWCGKISGDSMVVTPINSSALISRFHCGRQNDSQWNETPHAGS